MNAILPPDDPAITDDTPLKPDNAVGAIMLDPDGRYLLQLRDRKRGIFFPNHWGCFGGATERTDADDLAAMRREIREELDIDISAPAFSYFTRYTFDMSFCGAGVIYRTFFEVRMTPAWMAALRLGEGREIRGFGAHDVLGVIRIAPYDTFALWMHINRGRLKPAV